MKRLYINLNCLLSVLVLFLFTANASAQTQADSIRYNHLDVFGPITWPVTSVTRTASGRPGQHYWQNRADYLIGRALPKLLGIPLLLVRLLSHIPTTALTTWVIYGCN
jgi:hypothetical protein